MAVLLGTEKDRSFDSARRRRTRSLVCGGSAALLLLLALLLQGAYRYRGEIAVLLPTPSADRARVRELGCEKASSARADCSVSSLRSPSRRVHPNVMVLTVHAQNRAAFVQAFPAGAEPHSAEGQTVARRVLMRRIRSAARADRRGLRRRKRAANPRVRRSGSAQADRLPPVSVLRLSARLPSAHSAMLPAARDGLASLNERHKP